MNIIIIVAVAYCQVPDADRFLLSFDPPSGIIFADESGPALRVTPEWFLANTRI